jgi:hypothetical protein
MTLDETPPFVLDDDRIDALTSPDHDQMDSFLDTLRDEAHDSVRDRTICLPIAKHSRSRLHVEFRYRPLEEIAAPKGEYRGMPDAQVAVLASADTLVKLHTQLVVKQSDGSYRPLGDLVRESPGGRELDLKGDRIGFDDQLRLVLGWKPIANARQTVFDLYDNEHEIMDVAEKLSRWLKDTTLDGESVLLGG